MAQEHFKALLQRNKDISSSWQPMPTIKVALAEGWLSEPRLLILTCADSRADPTKYLDLQAGEVTVLRNAGGRVTDDVLRSLELISTVGGVGMVAVIHHTDCGCLWGTEESVKKSLSERAPEHAKEIEGKVWGTFGHIGLEQSIRDDVATLRKWKFAPKDLPVVGYVFDIEKGVLRSVEDA